MIETNLQHQDLINNEPALEDQLSSNQVDFQEMISMAYRLMIQDIKNQNIEIRRLCKKLWLQETSKTVTTATYNSDTSNEDFVERMRWVINVTSLTGVALFTLQGRYKTSETWTSIRTVQITETGIHKFLVLEVRPNQELEIYKYYRIQKVDATSTVTFRSYLVEMTYENLHLFKTLGMIFENLATKGDDIYRNKAEKYTSIYDKYLVENKYYYDSDDDQKIDEIESESDYREIILGRG
jgi:hypothetical protein